MIENITETSPHQLFHKCLPDGIEIQVDDGAVSKCNFPDDFDKWHIDDDFSQRHTRKVSKSLENAFPQIQEDLKAEISEEYANRLLAELLVIYRFTQDQSEQNPFERSMKINDMVSQIQFPAFLAEFAAKRLSKQHPAWRNINQADIDNAHSFEVTGEDIEIKIHDAEALKSDTTNKNIIDDMSWKLANWEPQDIIKLLQNKNKQEVFIANYTSPIITHFSKTSQ